MNGAHSRRKGAAWDRQLARKFRAAMPGATTAESSSERAAVDDRDAMPRDFAIVAERHRKANVRAALRRACAGAPRGEWPIAVCKDERAAPFVAMTLDHFLAMCAEWWAWRQR